MHLQDTAQDVAMQPPTEDSGGARVPTAQPSTNPEVGPHSNQAERIVGGSSTDRAPSMRLTVTQLSNMVVHCLVVQTSPQPHLGLPLVDQTGDWFMDQITEQALEQLRISNGSAPTKR